MFSVPNSIVLGGLTGVATVINHLFPLVPVGTAIFLMNIPLFLLGLRVLRGEFFLKTLCATGVFTLFIDLGSLFIPAYKGDTLLSCIFCGVLSGAGLALVFMTGATTGGTDIIAALIRAKSPLMSMGRLMLLIDCAVVGLAFIVYGKIESLMYSIIALYLTSRLIDFVLYGNEHAKLIFIVTDKSEAVLSGLLLEIGRGATVLPVTGGYTGENRRLILCAAKKNQIRNILKMISRRDPEAFTVICEAGQVYGKGFYTASGI